MTSDRRRLVEQLCHAAVARAAGERGSFLDTACAGDAALRREGDSQLAQQISAASQLLDGPTQTGRPNQLGEASLTLLAPGSQLGPYQILSVLGSGGMGHVYRAFDPRLRRDVAIKVARERFGERFDREV